MEVDKLEWKEKRFVRVKKLCLFLWIFGGFSGGGGESYMHVHSCIRSLKFTYLKKMYITSRTLCVYIRIIDVYVHCVHGGGGGGGGGGCTNK